MKKEFPAVEQERNGADVGDVENSCLQHHWAPPQMCRNSSWDFCEVQDAQFDPAGASGNILGTHVMGKVEKLLPRLRER